MTFSNYGEGGGRSWGNKKWVNRAKQYLADGKHGVSVNQHKADIERLEGQIQQLQAQVEALSAKRVRNYLLAAAMFAPILGTGLPNADAGS